MKSFYLALALLALPTQQMLKEIYDQPQCLQDCISGRLTVDNTRPELNKIVLSAVEDYKERLISAKHIIIVACGTSWHAGLIGKQLIEKTCRIRVEVVLCERKGLTRAGRSLIYNE